MQRPTPYGSEDDPGISRAAKTVDVKGTRLSYLEAGSPDAPPVVLLHGTLLEQGLAAGPSGTRPESCTAWRWTFPASVTARMDWTLLKRLSPRWHRWCWMPPMCSVWTPSVERFRDPAVRAGTSSEELLATRTKTMQPTVERPLSAEEIEDYVFPWQSPDRARSWMAMAGAADPRYTLDLLPALKRQPCPRGSFGGGMTTSRRSALIRTRRISAHEPNHISVMLLPLGPADNRDKVPSSTVR